MLKKIIPVMFFLACVLLAVFPLFGAGYLFNSDDDTHVYLNRFILDGHLSAAWRIFFSPDTANKTYIPLTVLTFLYERVLWGLNPLLSHAINLLLHGVVCALAWCLALELGLSRRAAYVAVLLFAIHPMHVEPVAWITSRKDMLYASFYLAALILYGRYLEKETARNYIVALAASGLSVLAKPMALSLPLSLCLLDAMRGRRLSWAMVLDKIPFVLAVEPVALITYILNARAIPLVWPTSFFIWWWCATFYLQKFFWPWGLSVLYNVPFAVLSWSASAWQLAVVFAGSKVLYWLAKSRRLFLFAGGFFAVSLFFIWRFDTNADLNVVADRFMYLPSLGICFLLGQIADGFLDRSFWAKPALAAIFALMAAASFFRSLEWKDPFVLWQSAVRTQPSVFALNARGELLANEAFYSQCKNSFITFVARRLGTTEEKLKAVSGSHFEQKVEAFRRLVVINGYSRAIRMQPENPNTYYYKGSAFMRFHDYQRALECFDKATVFSAEAFCSRGMTYQHLGKPDLAMKSYDKAVLIDPSWPDSYIYRARLFLLENRPERALADALTAVQVAPTCAAAYDEALFIAHGFEDQLLEDRLRTARQFFLSKGESCSW